MLVVIIYDKAIIDIYIYIHMILYFKQSLCSNIILYINTISRDLNYI